MENSCARICNPSQLVENVDEIGKRPHFVHDRTSSTCKSVENGELRSPVAVEAVCRSLRSTLPSGGFDDWCKTAAVLRYRLTDAQLAGLAWAALRSLEPDHAGKVAETVLGDGEMPLRLLGGVYQQARFWAEQATRSELKAYTAATFRRLPPSDRRAFLTFARGEV